MKKIILLSGLFFGLILSCNKEEIKQDCIDRPLFQIYEDQIALVYQNAPLSLHKIPGGSLVSNKFVIPTSEIQRLFELRDEAYKDYLRENEGIKGNIQPLSIRKWCWWCECPVCHWVGNMYGCMGYPGQACGGWNCQGCGYQPLSTISISCDYGYCVGGK